MHLHVYFACRAYLTSMTSVRLSVCLFVHLSVSLVDCDHIAYCNKKWKWANDTIHPCLGYLHAKADPDHDIL